jgi:MFS family permease
MLAERIKVDFGLTDQLGFLAGPASIICYLFVGIPLARLADIWPRKYVLAGGVSAIGLVTVLGGIAQTFTQFVGSRVFLAAGGSAHAPSSYSLIADMFPPQKITRAFAILQFGFIGGSTLGPSPGADDRHDQPLGANPAGPAAHPWLAMDSGVDRPARLSAGLAVPHLARTPAPAAPRGCRGAAPWLAAAPRPHLHRARRRQGDPCRRRVYYPLFIGLALSALESFGLAFWRVPFLIRTYGWTEAQIGTVTSLTVLVSSLLGLLVGGTFVEWLAKRHKDANVRAAHLFAVVTVCSILSPLMPTADVLDPGDGVGAMFGIAGAVPQNAAIQRMAPHAMRGQVTAIYLFMFTFFGAMGSFVVGVVAQRVVVDPARLWIALVITAAPCCRWPRCACPAIRPYREEIERLEALEQ